MSPKFIRCENCEVEVPTEECGFASYRTEIDGEEYVFCCKKCADRYLEKKKE